MSSGQKNTPHYHGHRQRLREKLLNKGPDTLADYELLELLLTMALPRRDVKPLAKELLERFGSFGEVATATPAELMETSGIKETAAAAIKAVEAGAIRLLQDKIAKRNVITHWDELIDYCRAAMAREKVEQFRILFLDSKNNLIADEIQQKGTVNHTPVYPREVVKRALDLGATALIMVHNHPSGDTTPSRADIEMTRKVAEATKTIGITLHDHVIVSKQRAYSFKAKGKL